MTCANLFKVVVCTGMGIPNLCDLCTYLIRAQRTGYPHKLLCVEEVRGARGSKAKESLNKNLGAPKCSRNNNCVASLLKDATGIS